MIGSTETRRRIEREVAALAKTGDVIFRYGDAKHYEAVIGKDGLISFGVGLRFSKIVCVLTAPFSPYSHAAVLDRRSGRLMVWDMSDEGLREFTFRSWMRETHGGGAIEIRRLVPELAHMAVPVVEKIDEIEEKWDPEYDKRFIRGDKKFYCLEILQYVFDLLGIPTSELVDLRKLPGWKWVYGVIAWKGKIHLDDGLVIPGNDIMGVRSWPSLETIHVEPGDSIDEFADLRG
jgi:hypothetical protein